MLVIFFFFKQKTAYEMRISDWSSDVCSSDLPGAARPRWGPRLRSEGRSLLVLLHFQDLALHRIRDADAARPGDRLAVFLDHHGTEDLFALAAAEQAVGFGALQHRRQPLDRKSAVVGKECGSTCRFRWSP